ncbi:MAG: calcium/sodium antiporter [Candidatus Methanomethylophilaceae archaeon]|nr:calcium/sodium antiporter [Candidatus Methanomethylophilaceae archaeon]
MDWVLLGIPVGIVFLYFGSEALVDGGKNMALRLGITPFVIGLTVLAFGTSAPEAITSIVSRNDPGIIIGNVVGSNIVNIAVCIGLAAMIFPIASKFEDNRIEFITMVLASLIVLVMAFGGIGTVEGIILLLLLALFIFIIYKTKVNSPEAQAEAEEMGEADMPMWKCVLFILVGLVLLYFGADMFVDGSKEVAEMMGVSELVIGLFLVAIGTSLPELCVSIMAAFRHENDIAVSNIIGSNIFNAFFVLGIGATISDIPVYDSLFTLHIPVMILLSVLMALFIWRWGRVSRVGGAVLVAIYVAYAAIILAMPDLAM